MQSDDTPLIISLRFDYPSAHSIGDDSIELLYFHFAGASILRISIVLDGHDYHGRYQRRQDPIEYLGRPAPQVRCSSCLSAGALGRVPRYVLTALLDKIILVFHVPAPGGPRRPSVLCRLEGC